MYNGEVYAIHLVEDERVRDFEASIPGMMARLDGRWFCRFPSCGNSSFHKNNVRRHLYSHLPTGTKRFKCLFCEMRTAHADSMRKHFKKAHLETNMN